MSIRIVLDQTPPFFTNYDIITGRIILLLKGDEKVSSILVKLEGESRTALARPPAAGQNFNPSLITQSDQQHSIAKDNHKVLYQVSEVFPNKDLGSGTGKIVTYTIKGGQHEYPFQFKLPRENSCWDTESEQMGSSSGLKGSASSIWQQTQGRHIKTLLPPSLSGLSGKGEIEYYLKVTVHRPSIFKENMRSSIGFRFMPSEPSNPLATTKEVYARRGYHFQNFTPQEPDGSPKGEVDARLPAPAVLTRNELLPLRIIVRNLHQSPEQLYLMTLQVYLIGYTDVRAREMAQVETSTWTLVSANNLAKPIGTPNEDVGTEKLVDSWLWDNITLPGSAVPSFRSCNLTRRYELEVRVGLGYGAMGNLQQQTVFLCFQIEIFSGISLSTSFQNITPSSSAATGPPNLNATPVTAIQPQPGPGAVTRADDAPPSYQDTVADG